MLYFDTTYLYRVYSTEPGHEAVKGLLSTTDSLATAWHGRAEFASILLRKRREGADSPEWLASLESQFQQDCQSDLTRFLPLTEPVMLRLERTLRDAPSSTNIRAADALHLACAAEYGFTEVHSNNHHFLACAPLFGQGVWLEESWKRGGFED
jgi:predicted nucleic acid-binding protein